MSDADEKKADGATAVKMQRGASPTLTRLGAEGSGEGELGATGAIAVPGKSAVPSSSVSAASGGSSVSGSPRPREVPHVLALDAEQLEMQSRQSALEREKMQVFDLIRRKQSVSPRHRARSKGGSFEDTRQESAASFGSERGHQGLLDGGALSDGEVDEGGDLGEEDVDGAEGGDDLAEIFVPDIPVHGAEEGLEEVMDRFQRVSIDDSDAPISQETKEVCSRLLEATEFRKKYQRNSNEGKPYWGGLDESKFEAAYVREREALQQRKGPSAFRRRLDPPFVPFPASEEESLWTKRQKLGPSDFQVGFVDGVMQVTVGEGAKSLWAKGETAMLSQPPTVTEFYNDLFTLVGTVHDAACKSLCYQRLELLESLFSLHRLLNAERENEVQKAVPHRDFYNVRKVDTHIHHSAIMNQKHLLRFIKSKLKKCPNEVVIKRDGKFLTLSEVFRSLKLTAYDLSIDTLDMHASDTFHRFDRFNLKYNPIGESRLREIFIKTDNLLAGRYLAEITKEVFSDAEANKYVMMEPRVSVYGRNPLEWAKLGTWYATNELASPNVRWMVQIPRLYAVYKATGQVQNFQDMLTNIFEPLFAVTLDPGSNPELDNFLNMVTGFDCVDDESKLERNTSHDLPLPSDWDQPENPPYSYWVYYIYANLYTLNGLRRKLGMSEFSFRPHAGEAGDFNNLAATFLCASGINHGILLRKAPTLQYLYYLTQIGMALSPTSNCKLFLDYQANPFPTFFARGLNVSLSTDDPLLLHLSKDPLVEEYSIASQIWRLSSTDVCEIAKNSVLQSGYEHPYKRHFLGEGYLESDSKHCGNNITHTNVPNIRVLYRRERLQAEWDFVRYRANAEI
nr:AMPD [Schizochytrium sp.]